MNKIRTLEQLDEFLSDAIIWRKKELADVKSLIRSNRSSKSRSVCLIRSGVTLLYAHWEGFIKEAAKAYLCYVAMQPLMYAELSANFVALAMKRKLDEARETNKATVYTQVTEFFLTGLHEKSRIPWENPVTTSNLSSEAFREIVCMLGLDYSLFETKEKLIDERLLRARNNVAHGKDFIVTYGGFMELHEEVIELLNQFNNQISNAVFMKTYRQQ